MDDLTSTAWRELGDGLRAFIRRRIADPHDADDVLQDVFLKIHRHREQLSHDEKLRPWLYQTARHAIIDYYRSRAADPEAVQVPDNLPDEPEPLAVIDELTPCLRSMIARLPDTYRRAVTMADLENHTQEETASLLGLSLSGAKSRIQRGRRQLRSMIMTCCRIELDRAGRVVDYEPRDSSCLHCCT